MKIFSFNRLQPDKTLQIGDIGVVISKITGRLRTPETMIKPILLPIGTKFKITGFNRDTECAIVSTGINGESCMVEIYFSVLIENTLIDYSNNKEPIRCIHVSNTVKTLIDTDVVIFVIVMMLTYTCGLIIGMLPK